MPAPYRSAALPATSPDPPWWRSLRTNWSLALAIALCLTLVVLPFAFVALVVWSFSRPHW